MALTLVGLVFGPRAKAAEPPPCQPAARLDGDEASVGSIARALKRRGIAPVAWAPTCREVAVEVRRNFAGFSLVISDAEGHTAHRDLPSAESAALVIESWSRRDLASPLREEEPEARPFPTGGPVVPIFFADTAPSPGLPEEPPPEPRSRTKDAASDAELVAGAAPVESSSSLRRRGVPSFLSVAIGSEATRATDGSNLWGTTGAICLRTGPLCTGLRGHYDAAFAETSLPGAAPSAVTTNAAAPGPAATIVHPKTRALLATVELPMRLGSLVIMPGLGLGAGWSTGVASSSQAGVSAARTHPHGDSGRRSSGGTRRNNSDGSGDRASTGGNDVTPTGGGTVLESQDSQEPANDTRLLGHAGLTLSLPIGLGFAIDGGIYAGMALRNFGDAGLPRGHLRGGIGLRFGAL